jgi:hypothetical protein
MTKEHQHLFDDYTRAIDERAEAINSYHVMERSYWSDGIEAEGLEWYKQQIDKRQAKFDEARTALRKTMGFKE